MEHRLLSTVVALVCAVGALSAVPQPAEGQSLDDRTAIGTHDRIGLGIGGPYPIGLSGKYYLDPSSALQSTVGVPVLESDGSLGVTFDYVFEEYDIVAFGFGEFDLHLGVGAVAGLYRESDAFGADSWFEAGLRAVVGPGFKLRSIPLEFAVEWTPDVRMAVGVNPGDDLAFHPVRVTGYIRYYL